MLRNVIIYYVAIFRKCDTLFRKCNILIVMTLFCFFVVNFVCTKYEENAITIYIILIYASDIRYRQHQHQGGGV